MTLHPPFESLLGRAEILGRTAEIGRQLSEDLGSAGRPLILCVAVGGRVFCRHLVQSLQLGHLQAELEQREVTCSSYGDRTESSGKVEIRGLEGLDLSGRDVLIVEDIVDTGNTLTALIARLEGLGAARVRAATLLSKPSRRTVEVALDFVGFEVDNHFVVGFGMDVAGRYRDLPYVGVYDQAVATAHDAEPDCDSDCDAQAG